MFFLVLNIKIPFRQTSCAIDCEGKAWVLVPGFFFKGQYVGLVAGLAGNLFSWYDWIFHQEVCFLRIALNRPIWGKTFMRKVGKNFGIKLGWNLAPHGKFSGHAPATQTVSIGTRDYPHNFLTTPKGAVFFVGNAGGIWRRYAHVI